MADDAGLAGDIDSELLGAPGHRNAERFDIEFAGCGVDQQNRALLVPELFLEHLDDQPQYAFEVECGNHALPDLEKQFKLLDALFERFVVPHILDDDGGLAGNRRQQLKVVPAEGIAAVKVVDIDTADRLAFLDNRHTQPRLGRRTVRFNALALALGQVVLGQNRLLPEENGRA